MPATPPFSSVSERASSTDCYNFEADGDQDIDYEWLPNGHSKTHDHTVR